jgi:hypothetical protein
MDELMGKIILAVVLAVVVPLMAYALRWAAAYLKNKAMQVEDEAFRAIILEAINTVEQSVIYVMQTYVDSLKRSGSFTPEAQSKAFEMAKSEARNMIDEQTQKIIAEEYGNFDLWLNTKIEQTVRETKTPEKK